MSDSPFPPQDEPRPGESTNPYLAPQTVALDDPSSYVNRSEVQLNPWVSIWTKPRATIWQIVDTEPTYMVLQLAAVSGIGQALDRAALRSVGDQIPLVGILLMALIAGPIGGLIGLYFFGWLVRLTGSWLGGVATSLQVRTAAAWAMLPTAVTTLIWIPQLAIFGSELFTSESPKIDANGQLLAILLGFTVVEGVLGIWQVVLLIKCVAEVHQFSAWRGLGSLMLSGLLVVLVIAVPVILLVALAAAANG